MSGYSSYYAAPTTQQAVVTVNAGLDRLYCNYRKNVDTKRSWTALITSDDHAFSIVQRELCFKLKDKHDGMISRPSCSGINNLSLKVFSSANNLTLPAGGNNGHEDSRIMKYRQQMRDMFTFVGVATTPLDYLNTNSKDTLALQIAGSISIYNTGPVQIRAGQRLIWDVPSLDLNNNSRKRTIRGEPTSKRLFMIMPLEDALTEKRASIADGSNDFTNTLHLVHAHATRDPPPTGSSEEAQLLHSLWTAMVKAAEENHPTTEKVTQVRTVQQNLPNWPISLPPSGAAARPPLLTHALWSEAAILPRAACTEYIWLFGFLSKDVAPS
jgi:hypothetical protein